MASTPRLRATALLALSGLLLVGCQAAPMPQEPASVEQPRDSEPAAADTDQPAQHPRTEDPQGPDYEATTRGKSEKHHFHNRVSFLIANTVEAGEHDQTIGIEYERYLGDHWGIGAFIDWFEGEHDSELVAIAGFYHPVPEVGLMIAPGYQFRDGKDDRAAFRVGMFYEFDLNERFAIAPSIYTDFLSGGERSSVLGVSVNVRF